MVQTDTVITFFANKQTRIEDTISFQKLYLEWCKKKAAHLSNPFLPAQLKLVDVDEAILEKKKSTENVSIWNILKNPKRIKICSVKKINQNMQNIIFSWNIIHRPHLNKTVSE